MSSAIPPISLRFKTIVFVSILVIGTAVTLGAVFHTALQTVQSREFEERARARASSVAAATEYSIFANDREAIQQVLDVLVGERDVRYAIVWDTKGKMVAHAGQMLAPGTGASPTELEQQAVESGSAVVRRLARELEVSISDLDVAVPTFIEVEAEELSPELAAIGQLPEMKSINTGVVQVGFSADHLLLQQAQIRARIIQLSAGFTVVAILVAAFLSSYIIVNPIRRLSDATKQVAAGDLAIRVPVGTSDEIGALAQSFNQMTKDLRQSREELDSYHRTLEFQVAERTDALRMANEELRRINDELEQASRLKSEFLANMSHELRTPLNAIIGFSELLSDQVFGPLNDKQLRYVANVLESGRHLLNLINEILDLAKVESGKMELQMENFNPESAISDVTNILRPLAQKKNLNLLVEAPQPLGMITADEKKFKQILYNLISNAIKFTPEEGKVTVTATLEPKGPTPMFVRVSVRDTGIGIAPEDQDRIFNEFEQVDGTHSRQYAGTGLGLALTRKIVELHHGKIQVKSVRGEGSTFTFTLPLQRPEHVQHTANHGLAAAGSTVSVAYVGEGSNAQHDTLDTYLREHGFEVTWLRPEDRLVDRIRSLEPGVIILDLTGNPAAAYASWQVLHSTPETAVVPTILFIGPEVEAEGFALCAAAHFSKPVQREALLGKLQELVPHETEHPGRILVVDDDPQYLEVTKTMLETAGYTVSTASDGEDGIAAIDRETPDLVLLDLMMPKVNGFEVVAHLRQRPECANIPIVVVTAKDLSEADMRILNGHVASIAQKGLFSREDLLRAILQAHGHLPVASTVEG